jgi:hypothetical protein
VLGKGLFDNQRNPANLIMTSLEVRQSPMRESVQPSFEYVQNGKNPGIRL